MQGALSDRDRAILELEATHPRHNGRKEEVIRTRLGMSSGRYYQLLDRLVDSELALQHDPMLIGRLRRLRENRAVKRAGRMRGFFA